MPYWRPPRVRFYHGRTWWSSGSCFATILFQDAEIDRPSLPGAGVRQRFALPCQSSRFTPSPGGEEISAAPALQKGDTHPPGAMTTSAMAYLCYNALSISC